jgi:hypothetical protein
MKKMKLTILLTLVCLLFFSSGVYSQGIGDPLPVQVNTITRPLCLSGFSGCSSTAVDIKLSSASGIGSTKTIYENDSKTYPSFDTRIKVTITGTALTSTGLYTLPAVIGDQVVIPSTDGITPLTVIITKTGTRQFKLEVANFSF